MKRINEYKNRFNQLLESTIGNVKPLISENVESTPNVNLNDLDYEVISEGDKNNLNDSINILKNVSKSNLNNEITLNIIPNRFESGETIKIKTNNSLIFESVKQYPNVNTVRYGRGDDGKAYIEIILDTFEFNPDNQITLKFIGNVDGGQGVINLNMEGSTLKELTPTLPEY